MPERKHSINRLKAESFDILVVGGGSTGSGIALDAASRGYKVALVEGQDFASGTSGRSTKLIHGGVRYLERAVLTADLKQLGVVRDSLSERKILLDNAPHLTRTLPIVIPIYHWYHLPYYWIGIKLYEILSGKKSLGTGRFLSANAVIEKFPWIGQEGLYGGILFYDGQFDDVRMNVSIALTAEEYGATIANYVKLKELKKENGIVNGGTLVDLLSQEEFEIRAKVVVNAAGPFVDNIRHMDQPGDRIVVGSEGAHIILDQSFTKNDYGIILPKTSSGRVLFLLPWQGKTLVGTTDNHTKIRRYPKPCERDIAYLVDNLQKNLGLSIRLEEIHASWAGIRPLIKRSDVKSTALLTRDYVIEKTPSQLYTISGGKWTTYRKMARDLMDRIVENGDLKRKKECQTENIRLTGEKREAEILEIAKEGYDKPLAEGYPYLEAEVIYAIRNEKACHAMDILTRRTHLAMLDHQAAEAALPRVVAIMAKELGWSKQRQEQELAFSLERLI